MFHSFPTTLKSYSYNKSELKKVGNEKQVIDFLISLVETGEIWFPYKRYFHLKPCEMFSNLKNLDLQPQYENYKLISYFPSAGLYLPPRFRGKSVVISTSETSYFTTDALSDYFIENVRMKAKRYDQTYSIDQEWKRKEGLEMIFKKALESEDTTITPQVLRDAIYFTFAETQVFSVSWAKALVKIVLGDETKDKRWLDISSGWGDRLLTAMALDMEYLGFDPNKELITGHSEMIDMFGDRSKHRVIYEPFEKGLITGEYDLVFTSPPYFTVEEYVSNQPGQSIVEYPDFVQWMTKFLFVSLEKAWRHLKEDGYLILHISDTKNANFTEATNLFIEEYLPNSSWEGIIGVKRFSGPARGVWVWKKSAEKKKWNSFRQRSLKKVYPILDAEWKTYSSPVKRNKIVVPKK